ncbi:MAG: hypothetical protein J6X44_09475 [Thermoguttaceae bacterium]|nr:hypothetical protein [Thermoguttaceae bacterium]
MRAIRLLVFALFCLCSSPIFADYGDWKFDSEQFEARMFNDWLMQDEPDAAARASLFTDDSFAEEQALIERVFEGFDASASRERLASLVAEKTPGDSPKWRELYVDACRERRAARLESAIDAAPQFVYTKHYVMGASHYAYTEDVSDEAYFDTSVNRQPGGQLCLATFMPDGSINHEVLVETPDGTIRDPDVSWDGTKVLFSMRKSFDKDDFHLYE